MNGGRFHSMPFEAAKVRRPRTEITKEDFEKLASSGLVSDGIRLVQPIKLKGLTWNKPMAYKEGDKYYRFDD